MLSNIASIYSKTVGGCTTCRRCRVAAMKIEDVNEIGESGLSLLWSITQARTAELWKSVWVALVGTQLSSFFRGEECPRLLSTYPWLLRTHRCPRQNSHIRWILVHFCSKLFLFALVHSEQGRSSRVLCWLEISQRVCPWKPSTDHQEVGRDR